MIGGSLFHRWILGDGTELGTLANPVPVSIQSGGGTGGTASTFGVAFPGVGTAVGAKDGSGNMVALNIDGSGNLKTSATASFTPPTSSTATSPAQSTVGTTAASALASNVNRKGLYIQNTGTTKIKLGLGANPTQTAYYKCLQTSGTSDDGFGGDWNGMVGGTLWMGAVNVISSSASGTYVITEIT